MTSWRLAAAIVVGVGFLALGPADREAQERIRIGGWVQWVAGTRMQMTTGDSSVAVDLRDADQDSYHALRPGTRVLVEGVVANDRSRVVAEQIWRDDRSEMQSP